MAGLDQEKKRADKTTVVDVRMKKKKKSRKKVKKEKSGRDGEKMDPQCEECEKELMVLTHARNKETKIEVITTVINKELEELKKQLSNDPNQSPTKLSIKLRNESAPNKTNKNSETPPPKSPTKGAQDSGVKPRPGDIHTLEFDYNLDEYKCNECTGSFCNHKMEAYVKKFCFPDEHLVGRLKRLHSLCLVSNLFCWACGNVFTSKEALMLHGIRHKKEVDTLRTKSEADAAQEKKSIPMCALDVNEAARDAIRKSLLGMKKSVKKATDLLDMAERMAEGRAAAEQPPQKEHEENKKKEEQEEDEEDEEEDEEDEVFQDPEDSDSCDQPSFSRFCKHKQKDYLDKFCFPEDQAELGRENQNSDGFRQRESSTPDVTWFCDECGSLFVGEDAIALHGKLHEKSTLEAVLHAMSSSGYQCVVCGDGFQTEMKLRAHIKKRHRKPSC